MASRNATARQPRNAQKPSTSQTGTSQLRSRGPTRGTGTQATERSTAYTEDTERSVTGSRRPTTNAGEGKSLFGGYKQARGGAAGDEGTDGVKADDIWNKFVSDDQNVVRAPTAESNVSEATRSSQRTGYSQASGSEGSQRPSQIEEEDEEDEEESEDDRTIYSDYYLPPEYLREEVTPGPRAEIDDKYEACSCFPNRSNKFVGSMLYDKITCKHTGLTGHTQPGVFKFNLYWNESMEEPRRLRKRDMKIARSKYVFGYPKPRFELMSESEEETDDYEDSEGEDDNKTYSPAEVARKGDTPKTAKTADVRAQETDSDDDDYDSDEYDSDEDDEEDDEDYVPYRLPEIGYPQTPSLPPSSQSFRSRYSDFTDYSESVPESLPSLPASRQLTAQTKRTGVTQRTQRTKLSLPSKKPETKHSTRTAKLNSKRTEKSGKKTAKQTESIDSGYDDDSSRRRVASRQSLPAGPVIPMSRTFQGKYYDPVTRQVMLYDIGTRPGKRIPDGNLEPLYKPPTADNLTPKASRELEPNSKPGTKGSKRSMTSQQSHTSVPKAAVLGAVFISNLLSKNKARKDAIEAGYSDDEDT